MVASVVTGAPMVVSGGGAVVGATVVVGGAGADVVAAGLGFGSAVVVGVAAGSP